jgi:hypothetical protein
MFISYMYSIYGLYNDDDHIFKSSRSSSGFSSCALNLDRLVLVLISYPMISLNPVESVAPTCKL